MTLGGMLSELYRRHNYANPPGDTGVVTRLTAFLNDALQELASEPGLGAWLTRNEPMATIASVANRSIYAVPAPTTRIAAITERTNNRKLDAMSRDWYMAAEPNPTIVTGTPSAWIPLGAQAVAIQPSDASEIFVKSTSASDTGTAYLEGIRTGGYPITLSASMTGTTAKSLGVAYTDIIQITKFYLSAAAVGTVTLLEDSGAGTELARIPIGQTFSRYQSFALWPTPASAITYYLEAERDLPDMANSNDEPPFPPRFHRVLVDAASVREYQKKSDPEGASEMLRRRDKGVRALRYFVTCPPDEIPSRQELPGQSRLGGQYPVTRW